MNKPTECPICGSKQLAFWPAGHIRAARANCLECGSITVFDPAWSTTYTSREIDQIERDQFLRKVESEGMSTEALERLRKDIEDMP